MAGEKFLTLPAFRARHYAPTSYPVHDDYLREPNFLSRGSKTPLAQTLDDLTAARSLPLPAGSRIALDTPSCSRGHTFSKSTRIELPC